MSGENPLEAAPLQPAAARIPVQDDGPVVLSGSNPLVAAANPLLNLIPQLRAAVQHSDPTQIREYLVREVQAFETRARALGVSAETILGARYCLCTALDETAAQTPWGGSGVWSRHSLLVTFHNETWGGEKFFQLLAKLAQNPQQHAHLLELMYYCLALGFEGRFRIVDNGRTQLETLKQRLLTILHQVRGEYERPLALHWQPAVTPAKRTWEMMPLWVTASLALLVAIGAYLWFLYSLADMTGQLFATINRIRAPSMTITRPVAVVPRFAKFLEPEVREGLVTVSDESDRSTVVLRGDGLFDRGSVVVKDRYIGVLNRIADALNQVGGQVLVTGYTDNTPIQTARFPSNWHLSQARAEAVQNLLDPRLTTRNRIRAEGRAEADPVAPNDTPANQAKNRRVVVTLLLPPPDIAAQLNAPRPAAPAPAPAPPKK